MSAVIQFSVLGPVEAAVDGRPLALGGHKPRALLAALVAEHGRVVSVDRIVDALWDDRPPRSARGLIQTYVAGLRRAFETAGASGVLRREGNGYLVVAGAVDAAGFVERVELSRGHRVAGRLAEVVGALREALAMWRGAAYGGLAGPVLGPAAAALDEARLSALDERIDAELALGRHQQLVGELTGLVATYPLREGLRASLIRALGHCGRQAEALEVYRRGRAALVEELGIEPGPVLRAAQAAVLGGGPLVATGPAQPAETSTSRARPAQLPAALPDFVGRADELAALSRALAPPPGGVAPPVAVITGRGGAGKSTLAVRVAHRLAGHYPDGQLYAGLAGMSAHPTPPEQVLRRFLRALAVDVVGDGIDDLATAFRSAVADRRLLVVLDDAQGATQVTPLLPGAAACGVLITSRARLGALPANRVDLDVLPADDARRLLAAITGDDRVHDEPTAASAIVAACGALPLALRIAGARLASRPHWPASRLAARLADSRLVLDELELGDEQVRVSVWLSYRGLGPAAARLLRLLGLLGAPDVAHWVAAPLLGVDEQIAEDALEELIEARLVDVASGVGGAAMRCQLHGLVLAFAAERARAEAGDGHADSAAVRRLAEAWLWLVTRIGASRPQATVAVHRRLGPTPAPLDPTLVELALADPNRWLDAERAGLVATVERAAEHGAHAAACDLASELTASVLVTGNHFEIWDRTHAAALAAAVRAGDQIAEAVLLAGLSRLRCEQDRFDEAFGHAQRALTLFEGAGDTQAVAALLAHVGSICRERGRLPEAADRLQAALRTARDLGDVPAVSYAVRLLGAVELEAGDISAAEAHLNEALALYRAAGNAHGEATALRSLGLCRRAAGDLDGAVRLFERARLAFDALGDELMVAYSERALAKTWIRQGRLDPAAARLPEVLRTCRRLRDRWGEAMTLRVLGELAVARAEWTAARDILGESIAVWTEIGADSGRARSLLTLAQALSGGGDHARAASVHDEARALLVRCGCGRSV
ncbi:AfsR/SARP family transcriptional regulator [Pilimelia columellifera]|uniref:BTAD domain-containing putative transcriptional regulator n=1 Tax=Pilimelia columellifera subsp. columellifera TaxID=706583 RepID=A0ABN3N9Y1_9ACTN